MRCALNNLADKAVGISFKNIRRINRTAANSLTVTLRQDLVDFKPTEPLYREALMIRETAYGKDSTELISTVEGLADTYAAGLSGDGRFPRLHAPSPGA